MGQLDLVIVNPGNRHQVYQSLGSELSALEPPVWCGLIATYALGRGRSVQIIDANGEGISPANVAERVKEFNPRLVVVPVYGHQPSASTQNMPAVRDIADAIRQLDWQRRVLLVGGHVASLPERTLREEAVDFVAVGEGLHTIDDMLGGSAPLERIRGLAYLDGGKFRKNQDGPLVTNLDTSMPSLPWSLLPMHRYRAHNWHCFGGVDREPYAAIYTTLGCPYACHFCMIQAPFRAGEAAAAAVRGNNAGIAPNSYRFWSPKRVGDTLERLRADYGVKNIKIADEMFVLNRRHVEGICDEIIARGLDLNIWAYARVDTVKDGMLPKLKKAGFNWLAFGVESGNAAVRAGADKALGHDQMMRTLEEVLAHDINVGANYIFGLPGDTRETMQQTLDLAIEINAEYANFYSAMAYPGSPLYDQAVREGWELPSSWLDYSQHSPGSHPLPTASLSSAEIVAFRDAAFTTYFSGERYRSMLKARFGDVATAEVDMMLSHKLTRTAI